MNPLLVAPPAVVGLAAGPVLPACFDLGRRLAGWQVY